MRTLWEELEYRGFLFQCTNPSSLRKRLENEKLTFYLGIDPTSTSLHVGHLVPIFLMLHLGKRGHRPIILAGGGTAQVGDPSGKSEARPLMEIETLRHNVEALFSHITLIASKLGVTVLLLDNDEWLGKLRYLDFLRTTGRHFSVNRMLSFDTYKSRLEKGLSFLEFNYQLLQAYDFLHLYRTQDCTIQIGGADQWANIVAGCDLIRREHGTETFGYTTPLIMRSDGAKMGKSVDGAIYCDAQQTSPLEFYQYWRNVSDEDVIPFLKLYSFLDKDDIERYAVSSSAEEINAAKVLLARSMTELIHGTSEADAAHTAARAAFYGEGSTDAQPNYAVSSERLARGISFVELYHSTRLTTSKNEARRLIKQGGARIGDNRITDDTAMLTVEHFEKGSVLLRCGKKKFIRLICSDIKS